LRPSAWPPCTIRPRSGPEGSSCRRAGCSLRDGLLLITNEYTEDPFLIYEDPFLLVGNCLLALLAAGLGGALAPLVAERNSV
jgi:hypothetical protein